MVFSPLLGDVGLEKADSRFLTSVFSMYSCRRERQDSPVASSVVFLLFPVQTSTSHEEKNPFANLFSPPEKGREKETSSLSFRGKVSEAFLYGFQEQGIVR